MYDLRMLSSIAANLLLCLTVCILLSACSLIHIFAEIPVAASIFRVIGRFPFIISLKAVYDMPIIPANFFWDIPRARSSSLSISPGCIARAHTSSLGE